VPRDDIWLVLDDPRVAGSLPCDREDHAALMGAAVPVDEPELKAACEAHWGLQPGTLRDFVLEPTGRERLDGRGTDITEWILHDGQDRMFALSVISPHKVAG